MLSQPFQRFLLPVVSSFVLCQCTVVGPDHQTPAVELPASFSQNGMQWKRESPGSQPKPQAWWKLYHDSTLTALVEKAMSGNQDLKVSAARLQQAREMSRAARSLYFPSINLGAGTDRTKFRLRIPGGGSSTMNSFTVPVDLNYEVDLWGKVSRQVESAQASEAAAAETLNAIRLSLASEVAQTYWALRAVDADRAEYSKTLDVRRKALELITRQRDVGSISGLDLARAETEVANAEADRIELDQQRVQLVNSLAVLTGVPATGASVPENAELPAPPDIPASVPSELLRQRPDIRAAEHRVAAANAEIGVATAAFYPSLTIKASTGLDAGLLQELTDAPSVIWSLGANVNLPVTGQKRLRAQRDAAVAAHTATTAEYRQTVLEALREVEDPLQGSAILVLRQAARDKALASALKAYDLSMKRYKTGLVSFLDVVDAERTRHESERNSNAVRAECLALSVSLIKALGGEW
ncbi:MAG: efflux transporter outer membrane subunit [Verrucomicrobiales bacterium]